MFALYSYFFFFLAFKFFLIYLSYCSLKEKGQILHTLFCWQLPSIGPLLEGLAAAISV